MDTAALRRKLTGRVWWTGIFIIGIYAVMAFGAPELTVAVRHSSLPWLVYFVAPFTGLGILGLFATLRSIPVAVFITRSCRKVLAQYSFDAFCPQITKVDAAQATKGRPKSMTLTLCTAEGQESPLMRIFPVPRPVAWRSPWPEGIDSGVYIAGDLPFGAVGYVPSSGAFFLVQPEDWDATAHDRKQADSDRVARAQAADLTRRIF